MFLFSMKVRSFFIPNLTKALEGHPILASEVSSICIVHDRPGCSIKDICMAMGADKGRMTNVIKHLMEAGIVENRSSARSYELFLTEEGEEEYDYAVKVLNMLNEKLTVNMTERQRGILGDYMRRIEEIVNLGYEYRSRVHALLSCSC